MDDGQGSSSQEALTYEKAGVSIADADEAKRLIRLVAQRTKTPRVLEGIGPFSASFYGRFEDMQEPILVASTDGVGTKVKLASRFKCYRSVGYDLVAVCANDIITTGATPLFFLDYIACHRVDHAMIKELLEGMTDGCLECGCAIIGGETAEMRDLYREGEFDLAGFMVGVVDKLHRITGELIQCGDVIMGLPSSGVHANGFTLVRKVFEHLKDEQWEDEIRELGKSLKQELLTPTTIYVNQVNSLFTQEIEIKGIAHISGGGIRANLKRILPAGLDARVYRKDIPTQPIFNLIQKFGNIADEEMWKVFNMGIGLIIILSPEEEELAKSCAEENDFPIYKIGEIVEGNREVILM